MVSLPSRKPFTGKGRGGYNRIRTPAPQLPEKDLLWRLQQPKYMFKLRQTIFERALPSNTNDSMLPKASCPGKTINSIIVILHYLLYLKNTNTALQTRCLDLDSLLHFVVYSKQSKTVLLPEVCSITLSI